MLRKTPEQTPRKTNKTCTKNLHAFRICRWSGIADQALHHLISDSGAEGKLSHCVVSAGQPHGFVGNPTAVEFIVALLCERGEERCVVQAGQHQEPPGGSL